MKLVVCIICFEVCQREFEDTDYDLSEYRFPFDVEGIYENFHSLSFKARQAMKTIYQYYEVIKDKPKLFDYTEGYRSYQSYAKKVF